jgi:hypothetical protein
VLVERPASEDFGIIGVRQNRYDACHALPPQCSDPRSSFGQKSKRMFFPALAGLPAPAQRLDFLLVITHMHHALSPKRLRENDDGRKVLLAYITGLVEQALLLRIEYLMTENRILRNHITERVRLSDGVRRPWPKSERSWGRKRWQRSPTSSRPTPFS